MSRQRATPRPPLSCVIRLPESRVRVSSENISAVASAIMADTRLSIEARGVALWLVLHPHQGTIMTSVLRQHVGCNLAKWTKVAREMEEGGYLVRDEQKVQEPIPRLRDRLWAEGLISVYISKYRDRDGYLIEDFGLPVDTMLSTYRYTVGCLPALEAVRDHYGNPAQHEMEASLVSNDGSHPC